MSYKAIFEKQSGSTQLWIFFALIMAGVLFASIIGFIFSLILSGETLSSTWTLRTLQFISAISMFLLPSIAIAWLCSNKPETFLQTKEKPSANTLSLVFFSILAISPAISLTAYFNQQISLPEFMAPIENWMQTQEDTVESVIASLLGEIGAVAFISNLIVLALCAAVTEEFFFRGALQRIIGKWTNNHHKIIWGTAILFSAFHLQFYGFIPRMLLGAFFGYLLYWTQSIWIPVFAHFVNNTFAVIVGSNEKIKNDEIISGNIQGENLLTNVVLAAIFTTIFFYIVRKIKKQTSTQQTPIIDN